MIIRKPTILDIPGIMKLIDKFQKEVIDDFKLFCNNEKAREFIEGNLENALIAETENKEIVGAISGIISTYPLNNEPIYQEIIWYIDKRYRRFGIRLLQSLEEKCKKNGIKHIIMVHMNYKAEELKKFYISHGYKELETQYIKNL